MTGSIEKDQQLLETLRKANPILNPIELAKLFPSYKAFRPFRKSYGLWSTSETLRKIITSYMQQDRVLLEISGVAAGGKDAIRENIEKLSPGLLFKAVTATSRSPREGEHEGIDYYFYDGVEKFREAEKRGEFIEWVLQGDRLYGMPKKSLLDALNRREPVVVTHVEMESGWPAIDNFLEGGSLGRKVFPLKVFVLPNMKFSGYADVWLPKKRDDVTARLKKAAWEISEAANNAHLIITNTIGTDTTSIDWESQALANHCIMLLKDEGSLGFHTFETPFEISPGIVSNQQIADYHQQKVRRG